MEVSKYFLNILKSIDYHVGHLPRDLFANEEQLPELLPIFMWFINNVTPASNCVTPKELTLYASLSSKHDNYSSLEKVSKAIDSFYDENTKSSKVSSLDLETLEKNISKSQQELNDLKSHGTLYEKKIQLVDDEISLLKQQESDITISCNEIENNLYSTLKKFTEQVDLLGFNVNKLHNQVTSSMMDENICLIKLASKNLIHLTDAWRQQIFKMINVWFKKENITSATNNICSKKVHSLGLLSQSVAELRMAEINEKCEIAKLKVALTNILNMKNNFIDLEENTFLSELDMTNYIAKYLTHQEILVRSCEQSTSVEYEDLQSRLSDIVIADAKSKYSELEIINHRITFIQDSIEHYIMINDVLWCLMRTACSMVNFKCELVLHCINFLENTVNDIENILQWTSNNLESNSLHTQNTNKTSICSEVVNFNGYKCYSNNFTNSDEIEKLSKMVQLWKSKYHYTRDECNKLTILQQKLQVYSDTVNGLTNKYSNMA